MVETRAQRINRAWAGVESEQGVMIDILSRLSVKNICSIKTVSKLWHGVISSRYFAKKHLSQSRETSYVASPSVLGGTMDLYLFKPGSFKFRHLTTADPSRIGTGTHYMHMISSFNGLVCCIKWLPVEYEDHFDDLQVWICNPSTEDTLLLPQGRPSFGTEPCLGIAYGPDISDYKVFRIFCVGEKNPEEGVFRRHPHDDVVFYREKLDAFLNECEVYSSSTGAWRNIGPVPHLPMPTWHSPHKSSHVFVKGKVYWLVDTEYESHDILSVDMEERFKVMKLPQYQNVHGTLETMYLINLGGSLSVVIARWDYFHVWVWKEDCKESGTWDFISSVNFPWTDHENVLFVTSSENEILFLIETELWKYDLDTKIWTGENESPTEFVYPAIFPFTESLLPCNGGVRLEGR